MVILQVFKIACNEILYYEYDVFYIMCFISCYKILQHEYGAIYIVL